MGGAIVIPLVGLLFPILLLIGALVIDAAFVSWVVYRVWHDREHKSHGGLLHKTRLNGDARGIA